MNVLSLSPRKKCEGSLYGTCVCRWGHYLEFHIVATCSQTVNLTSTMATLSVWCVLSMSLVLHSPLINVHNGYTSYEILATYLAGSL